MLQHPINLFEKERDRQYEGTNFSLLKGEVTILTLASLALRAELSFRQSKTQ